MASARHANEATAQHVFEKLEHATNATHQYPPHLTGQSNWDAANIAMKKSCITLAAMAHAKPTSHSRRLLPFGLGRSASSIGGADVAETGLVHVVEAEDAEDAEPGLVHSGKSGSVVKVAEPGLVHVVEVGVNRSLMYNQAP